MHPGLFARSWLTLVLLGSACGYRFTAPGGPLPDGLKAVQAPMFANRTAEPAAETLFTQAFREQLVRAGTLGDDASDARVEGTVLAVSSMPLVASPGKLTSYRLVAIAELKLLRNGSQLAAAVVQAEEDVPAGADPLLTDANRQAGLHRLAQTMMREGYERLCSGW